MHAPILRSYRRPLLVAPRLLLPFCHMPSVACPLSARCDFPGGSAEQAWDSIQLLYTQLPPSTRVFVGHDYPTKARYTRKIKGMEEGEGENIYRFSDPPAPPFPHARRRRRRTTAGCRRLPAVGVLSL